MISAPTELGLFELSNHSISKVSEDLLIGGIKPKAGTLLLLGWLASNRNLQLFLNLNNTITLFLPYNSSSFLPRVLSGLDSRVSVLVKLFELVFWAERRHFLFANIIIRICLTFYKGPRQLSQVKMTIEEVSFFVQAINRVLKLTLVNRHLHFGWSRIVLHHKVVSTQLATLS